MATTDVKITKKDNFNILYDLVSNAGLDKETEDRLHGFIDHELELISMRAEKSKKYQKEHRASDDAMSADIMQVLTDADQPLSVSDIANKIDGATAQKVVYRLGKLFKNDAITKDTQTIKTDNGNKRITFYSVVQHTAG